MTYDETDNEFRWARQEMDALCQTLRCCILGTVSSAGTPLSSYAPVFLDTGFKLYVYVSAMAKHYGHLRRSRQASVTLIEDEAPCENLFARKRLTMDCSATLVERDGAEWIRGTDGLAERGGETMETLKELSDFDLFRLDPSEGRLVLGFGKAYRVSGEGLSDVAYVGGGGHRGKTS